MDSRQSTYFPRALRLQPQRAIALLALVVGLLLCALVASDLLRDYEQRFSEASAKTSGLTQLLEEHARQSMRRVELSMSLAAREVQALAPAGKLVNAATGTHLRAMLPQDGLIASFAVLDGKGVIVASTLTEDVASLPHADDRDFYQALQNPTHTGLFVGGAVKSRISGLWVIPVSMRIEGGSDGYLMSTVDPAYFQHLYRSIDTGQNGSVTLFTNQGWAIARWPFDAEIAQHNWLDTPLFKTHIPAASVASLRETDKSDGAARVTSYRVLAEYPLVVSLALSLDDTLKPWRHRALVAVGGLLLVLFFLGAATTLLIAQLRRRLQAEAEIQHGAATLRDAIDAVDEAFVLFDKDDRLVYCNAKYLELYPDMRDLMKPGVHFEELIRMGASRGLYRDSIGREEAWIAERLLAHREGNERRIQKRDDGRVLRVIDRKTPQGNIVGIRVDITEMVRATEEAQEASRYKSQFLANMSHEIRTPMNAILGLLALLQNTELSPSQRDYAAKTEGAARSLLGLLNDILDFSKVEAGKLELDLQAFRLDRLLDEVSVILCSTIGGKPVEVLFDIDASVPLAIVGDSLRLQQVLVNLGGNAVKFTDQGQVVLGVHNKLPPENAATDTAWIEFSVQDSGIGIAPDKQAHIFTGFSQAEASTTRRFGGSGLGLAICKRLVELMGGSLALQSAIGLGSTFGFVLPFSTTPAQTDTSATVSGRSLDTQRVLIVDDNPVARDILSRMTRSWSWPTETAASGAQALGLIRAHLSSGALPFDVIYLDWQMPDMDGWETACHIRALCMTAQRPRIVMLTANGRDTLLLRTAQEQAMVDGFLFKPVMAQAMQDAATGRAVDAQQQRARRSSDRPLAGMRILVVEDNLINQQVAEELLNAEGALVSLAANGQLGVDAIAASHPPFDVVLMDIQMPVLDGYGATRKIREQLGLPRLPIVAMTANALASDRLACLAAGMNEHVGKPFDTRRLVALLLKVAGREGAVAEGTSPAELAPKVAAVPDAGSVAQTFTALSGPILDVAVALERLSGLTELYQDIGREYVKSLDAVEDEFRQAAAQPQWPVLTAQMHSLKGISATLGAQALSEHAARLEKLFRTPAADLMALEPLPDLLKLVLATRAAMQRALIVLATDAVQEPEPDRLAAGPGQRTRARAFLTELQSLLAANNLAVLDRFLLRNHALDALDKDHVEDLQAALQSLDLERARQICDACVQDLAVE